LLTHAAAADVCVAQHRSGEAGGGGGVGQRRVERTRCAVGAFIGTAAAATTTADAADNAAGGGVCVVDAAPLDALRVVGKVAAAARTEF
jgi:hypothetical protein